MVKAFPYASEKKVLFKTYQYSYQKNSFGDSTKQKHFTDVQNASLVYIAPRDCRTLFYLTLSLLGYLKTRICWGGVNLPPPLNPMFDVQIWKIIHHWKALVLYFYNLQKKLQICKNWIFYRKIQFYSKNVCKKKFVQKMKNYTFLKSPWPCHFKYAKIFAKL